MSEEGMGSIFHDEKDAICATAIDKLLSRGAVLLSSGRVFKESPRNHCSVNPQVIIRRQYCGGEILNLIIFFFLSPVDLFCLAAHAGNYHTVLSHAFFRLLYAF
jgi:hypothetical protein